MNEHHADVPHRKRAPGCDAFARMVSFTYTGQRRLRSMPETISLRAMQTTMIPN